MAGKDARDRPWACVAEGSPSCPPRPTPSQPNPPPLQVGVHYDPMIAKLIVHGPTREAALRTLHAALGETQVAGLPTNIEFMRRVTQDPDFQTVCVCGSKRRGGG